MKKITSLQSALLWLTLLVGGLVFSFASYEVYQSQQNFRSSLVIQRVNDSVLAMVTLLIEIEQANQQRIEEQWQANYDKLGLFLDEHRDVLVHFPEIRDVQIRLEAANHLLLSLGDNITPTIRENRTARLLMLLLESSSVAQQLSAKTQQELEHHRMTLIGFLISTVVGSILLLVLFNRLVVGWFTQQVRLPKKYLSQLMEVGFDEPPPQTSLKEIADILTDIQQVAIRLSQTMVSKEELEKEYAHSKEIEAKLRVAYQELQENETHFVELEKLSSLGTMVGGVSHEMNNPLMGISNYVQFVQKHLTSEQSKEYEMLNRAQNEVGRMQRLVQNMLKFLHQNSEIESANVDIGALLATVLDVTEPKCKKADIQVQVDIEPEAKHIFSNADLIQQIILNLVTNAIDAMENEKERLLRISVKREHEDIVTLSVTDTGSGISEKVRRKMFDPFFTTKEPGKGTGLGLSIVIRSIEALGAQIQVSDNVPHGAKFEIKFKVDSRTDENRFA